MRKLFAVLLFGGTLLALAAPVDAGDQDFVAHLSGRDEVPSNESLAQGQAIFHLSADGTQLDYRLIAANIDNVVFAHIHLAPAGVNGPVVAFLFGPVAGQPLTALVDAMLAGNTYVNAHTNDGVAPAGTGPGDLPAGEVRGQIH
jgi:hypothetical protein